MTKKILVITGTRADFGKLKPLMLAMESSPDFDLHVFVTGMHTLSRYGFTQEEVRKVGFKQPIDLYTGFRKTIEWYLNNGRRCIT